MTVSGSDLVPLHEPLEILARAPHDESSETNAMSEGVAAAVAAQAIAIANCVLKTGLAVALGTPQFRRVAGTALAGMALALAVSVGILR